MVFRQQLVHRKCQQKPLLHNEGAPPSAFNPQGFYSFAFAHKDVLKQEGDRIQSQPLQPKMPLTSIEAGDNAPRGTFPLQKSPLPLPMIDIPVTIICVHLYPLVSGISHKY